MFLNVMHPCSCVLSKSGWRSFLSSVPKHLIIFWICFKNFIWISAIFAKKRTRAVKKTHRNVLSDLMANGYYPILQMLCDKKFLLHISILTLSQPGHFQLQKPRGGGGHIVPLANTMLPFSESIQVKFFWKLVQKWISWHNFGFHGNHG